MAKKERGAYIHPDFWNAAQSLQIYERNDFLAACVEYWYTGVFPEWIEGTAKAMLSVVIGRIDAAKRGIETGAIRRNNNAPSKGTSEGASKGTSEESCIGTLVPEQEQEQEQDIDKEQDKERGRKNFKPPTLDEVLNYSTEQGLTLDASRFIDYYTAQGWRLSNGNKMKDWRAAARNWARRSRTEVYHSEYD